MADQTPARRRFLLIIVGLIVVAVAAYFVVAALQGGDKTGEINPQNNDVIVLPFAG